MRTAAPEAWQTPILDIAQRNRNAPVQDFYLGLDFTNIAAGARLAEGSYLAAQIPETLHSVWDWDEWVYHPTKGRVVSKALAQNYFIFTPPQQNLWVLSDYPWPPNRLYESKNGGLVDTRHRSRRLVLVPDLVPGLRDAVRFTGPTARADPSSRKTRSWAILRGL